MSVPCGVLDSTVILLATVTSLPSIVSVPTLEDGLSIVLEFFSIRSTESANMHVNACIYIHSVYIHTYIPFHVLMYKARTCKNITNMHNYVCIINVSTFHSGNLNHFMLACTLHAHI